MGGTLAEKILQWAEEELRLSVLPPLAVLEELCRPPRAAHLFSTLVERVRAPEHVTAACAAAVLCPREDESCRNQTSGTSAAQLAATQLEADAEANVLEEEIRQLQAQLVRRKSATRKRRQRARQVDEKQRVFRAVQDAYCEVIIQARQDMQAAEYAAMSIQSQAQCEGEGIQPESRDVEKAVGDVLVATCVVGGSPVAAGEDQSEAETALHLIETLTVTHDSPQVLDALARDAEAGGDSEASTFRSGIGYPGSDAEMSPAAAPVEDGRPFRDTYESVLKELQVYQMDRFMEAEEMLCAVREVEEELFEQESALNLPEASLLSAQLEGERAARAEAVRIEREFRLCRSTEAVNRDVEVERTRAVAARANLAEGSLVAQDRVLERMAAEWRRLFKALSGYHRDLKAVLSDNIPGVCASVCDAAIECETTARNRTEVLLSFGTPHSLLRGHGGAWSLDPNAVELDDTGWRSRFLCAGYPGDHIPSLAMEILSRSAVTGAFHQVLVDERRRAILSAHALGTRARVICEAIRRDRDSLDVDSGRQLERTISLMDDCNTRLVPAARADLEVWWHQPVRRVLSHATARRRNLTEWEDQIAEGSSRKPTRPPGVQHDTP